METKSITVTYSSKEEIDEIVKLLKILGETKKKIGREYTHGTIYLLGLRAAVKQEGV